MNPPLRVNSVVIIKVKIELFLRRSKIKKIEIAMINTLQLAARKYLIQMSLQW
jgi:hypothetical protein